MTHSEDNHPTAQRARALEVDLTVKQQLDMAQEKAEQGLWLVASGGTEVPFISRSGKRLLYCWQPSTGKHAYLDMGTDLILTDEEARLALMTY
jgi:hypothetical protein